MLSDIENFIFARAIPEPNSGCWLWILAPDKDGYGSLKRNRRTIRAHRFTYEQLVGPIPDGMELDHLCANKCCVNPQHLEPVTTLQNVQRMQNRVAGARDRLGETSKARRDKRTHCPKGHSYSGDNLRTTSIQRVCRACARENMRAYRLPEKLRREAKRAEEREILLERIKAMILGGYSIADICTRCGVSSAYIHREFKIRAMRKRKGKAVHTLTQF